MTTAEPSHDSLEGLRQAIAQTEELVTRGGAAQPFHEQTLKTMREQLASRQRTIALAAENARLRQQYTEMRRMLDAGD